MLKKLWEVANAAEITLQRISMGAFKFRSEVEGDSILITAIWESPRFSLRPLQAKVEIAEDIKAADKNTKEAVRGLTHAILTYEADRTITFDGEEIFDPGWGLVEVLYLRNGRLIPKVLAEEYDNKLAEAKKRAEQEAKKAEESAKKAAAKQPVELVKRATPAAEPTKISNAIKKVKLDRQLADTQKALLRAPLERKDLAHLRLLWADAPIPSSPKDSRTRIVGRLISDLARHPEEIRTKAIAELAKKCRPLRQPGNGMAVA